MRPQVDFVGARKQLARIFAAYPQLRSTINKEGNGDTICKMWVGLDLADLDVVIQRVVDGDARAYPANGSWHECGFHIKQMVKGRTRDRTTQEDREHRRQVLHDQATGEKLGSGTRLKMAMAASMECGRLKRAGLISETENRLRVDQLVKWDKGGPRPAWLSADGGVADDAGGPEPGQPCPF